MQASRKSGRGAATCQQQVDRPVVILPHEMVFEL